MKNQFAYLILVLILMLSCNEKTSKVEQSVLNETEFELESLSAKKNPDKTKICDLRTLKETDSILRKNLKLNDQVYLKFIVNMHIDCATNAEYSEWNNELIFKMLERNPEKFIAFLSRVARKTNSEEKTDFILDQLKNPINDGIKIKKIKSDLELLETENIIIKQNVIKSLNLAEQSAE
ncbi:hypothetical protein RBU60_13345 [Mesonia sp. MT50]|uniref:Lipoprotein n=1 Tax=Mesonia profundi TaxID=3070998 RepID=A0ABU1A4D7_9FLAO|nr:hypothetical protein [Mesonia profundi]MDQ7918558.1 hypothetical protein [Mesonia profundi]